MYNLPTSAKITVNKEAAGSDTVKLNSNICIRSTETDREEKRVLKYDAYINKYKKYKNLFLPI